jgi:hypothetical protein
MIYQILVGKPLFVGVRNSPEGFLSAIVDVTGPPELATLWRMEADEQFLHFSDYPGTSKLAAALSDIRL